MGDAGDQATERRQLLGGNETLLRLAQIAERLFRALLRGAQLGLGLVLGNRILAKHRHRPCHFPDFIVRLGALNGLVVFFRDDGVHSGHDFPKRPDDAARDHHPHNHHQGQEDDGNKRHVLVDVGQRVVEARLRLHFAQGHLCGEFVDHRDHCRLIVVDRALEQIGAHRQLIGERLQAVAERRRALRQCLQRVALKVVLGEIDHRRDGLLDRGDIPLRFVGRVCRQ